MLKELRPALVVLVALSMITGLVYPLAMTGLAAVIFPMQAKGSLIERNGKVVGSVLIGQEFKDARYFHGRPSATTGPDPQDPSRAIPSPYNASNSMGANLGPTSRALAERLKGDVDAARAENPSANIPVDLVTTSASGLDPHISPDSALFQAARVARTRNLPEAQVRELIKAHVEGQLGGILGEPRVNVLALNLALDGQAR